MNWNAIGAVAELLGAIGVIASLVYLAGQIRDSRDRVSENTRAVRAGAYQQFQENLRTTTMEALTVPSLEGVVFRGMDDPETLSEEEMTRFRWWLIGMFIVYENAHYQYRMGLLEEDRWRIHRSNLQSLLASQGIRQWWATRSDLIESPEFAALISEMLGNVPDPASVEP
jgi:hypothetical protein